MWGEKHVAPTGLMFFVWGPRPINMSRLWRSGDAISTLNGYSVSGLGFNDEMKVEFREGRKNRTDGKAR